MFNPFTNTNHPLLSRLCLAVALLPIGAAAGCDDKAYQAQEAISKTNLSSAMEGLQTMADQNKAPTPAMETAFGTMCSKVEESTGFHNYALSETRIEPACMEWAKGNPVNAQGMQRALSDIEDVKNNNHNDRLRSTSTDPIGDFINAVNRTSYQAVPATAHP